MSSEYLAYLCKSCFNDVEKLLKSKQQYFDKQKLITKLCDSASKRGITGSISLPISSPVGNPEPELTGQTPQRKRRRTKHLFVV